jgi:hypothetical protein
LACCISKVLQWMVIRYHCVADGIILPLTILLIYRVTYWMPFHLKDCPIMMFLNWTRWLMLSCDTYTYIAILYVGNSVGCLVPSLSWWNATWHSSAREVGFMCLNCHFWVWISFRFLPLNIHCY